MISYILHKLPNKDTLLLEMYLVLSNVLILLLLQAAFIIIIIAVAAASAAAATTATVAIIFINFIAVWPVQITINYENEFNTFSSSNDLFPLVQLLQ